MKLTQETRKNLTSRCSQSSGNFSQQDEFPTVVAVLSAMPTARRKNKAERLEKYPCIHAA